MTLWYPEPDLNPVSLQTHILNWNSILSLSMLKFSLSHVPSTLNLFHTHTHTHTHSVAQSCPTLRPHGYSPWNSLGQNTGVGSLFHLQGIFPTQGSNPSLPHYGWILCQLSHKGSPRILERVAYTFSRGSSPPRNQTGYQGSPQRWSQPLISI